jgi:hypothetical protein
MALQILAALAQQGLQALESVAVPHWNQQMKI